MVINEELHCRERALLRTPPGASSSSSSSAGRRRRRGRCRRKADVFVMAAGWLV